MPDLPPARRRQGILYVRSVLSERFAARGYLLEALSGIAIMEIVSYSFSSFICAQVQSKGLFALVGDNGNGSGTCGTHISVVRESGMQCDMQIAYVSRES